MPSKPVIYLIDDDEVNCFLIQNILSDTYPDSDVICFQAVEEALYSLKKVRNHPSQYPTLILLDLHLPKKDGWNFLEEYTTLQHNSFNKCDVIILTCSMYLKDLERAKRYSFVADFIAKPFTEESVSAKLDRICYRKKCL